MSPTPDSTLDDLQHTIADLQRQLADAQQRLEERTAERDEAQAQQAATAEVLQVINSSPGDLAPVFDAMLGKALRLCEAEIGTLWISDGERSHAVASRGAPPAYAEFLNRGPHPRPTRTRGIVHIPDIRETEFYRDGNPLVRAGADLGGVRTMLAVPLCKDEVVLGRFSIYRQEVRPFTDKQIALVQNFAAQAVIAMENARLLTETREALEQQTATAEVLQVINSSPGDLAPVFDAILNKAHTMCAAAHGGLLIRDGDGFRVVAARGFIEAWRDLGVIRPPPGSPPERLMSGELVVQLADARTEDFYQNAPPQIRELNEAGGVRSVLFVPLRKDEALLGIITAFRQEVRPFSDKQIALLQNFAAQAVIAMENARLLTETREALEQQTATAEVLQVINSSPGDLAPVFDAILEKAHTLCGAAIGALLTFDGESFGFLARKVPADLAEIASRPFKPGPQNRLNDLIRGEPLLHIPDAREVLALAPEDAQLHATVEVAGMRSFLAVPLRKNDRLIGAITAARQEIRPFTDKQIALLQNFAAQAVIAMDNARLITETREALEQQTATSEVLGVINSSPGDLSPVFDAMLEKAMRLCEADFGVLNTYDGKGFHRAAARGEPPAHTEWRLHRRAVSGPGTGHARIVAGEDVIHTLDLMAEAPYRDGDADRRAFVDLAGARTGLIVALRKEGTLLGIIRIYRQEVQPFTDKQIALLKSFAAQAVIAMENARLITETREALEQQTATAEVLQVINSSPGELKPVFEAMLDRAIRLCEAAHGHLLIYDGECFHPAAASGEPHYIEWVRQVSAVRPAPKAPLGRISRGERIVHIADLREEEVYHTNSGFRRQVDIRSARSQITVGLLKDNILLGAMIVYRQEVRPFSDKQIALLENFAAQAVIAMENARLINETREALEQQTATAEVLQVINSSPGDLAPVFDAMLEKATRLCEAPFGTLRTWDGERFHFGAVYGDPQLSDWVRRRGSFHPDGGPLRRIMEGEQVVQVADASSDAGYSTSPGFMEMVEASGMRSVITVALRKDEALLGTIHLYRQEVRPFTDKQIALLQNFAAQSVMAIENARLLGELRQRTEEVGALNRDLEARVAAQVDELGRVGRLKRFLAPQLAELIVSHGDEKILESHRREIVVVFCDLRGYTAFTETAEPEEVLDFLRQYHGALGPLVSQFEGTLDQFSGDGIMVFFNDPVPCPDPAERAVKMAMAMREVAGTLIAAWRRRGRMLGFGAGIAQGYATLGQIGFADRSGYTAIGTVCNLAARLCAEAKDGQILIAQLVAVAVEETTPLEEVGEPTLKGLTQPVVAYNVPLQAAQPALRVIEGGGPQSV